MDRSEALDVVAEVARYCDTLAYLHTYNKDHLAWARNTRYLRDNLDRLVSAVGVLGLEHNPTLDGVYRDFQLFVFHSLPMDFSRARRALDAVWMFYSLDLDLNMSIPQGDDAL